MDNDGKFWLSFWSIFFGTIAFLAGCITFNSAVNAPLYEETQRKADALYFQNQQECIQNKGVWIPSAKESSDSRRQSVCITR